MSCPKNCETCKSWKKPNRCHNKNVVYEIECLHCNGMTIGTHIKDIYNRYTVYSLQYQALIEIFQFGVDPGDQVRK